MCGLLGRLIYEITLEYLLYHIYIYIYIYIYINIIVLNTLCFNTTAATIDVWRDCLKPFKRKPFPVHDGGRFGTGNPLWWTRYLSSRTALVFRY